MPGTSKATTAGPPAESSEWLLADAQSIIDVLLKAIAEIPPRPLPLLLDQKAAWQFLGVSRAGFFRLKSAGQLPKPVHVPGSGMRYRRADLEKWAEKLKPVHRVPVRVEDVSTN